MIEAKYKAIKRKMRSIGFMPTIKLIISHLATLILYRNYLLFYVNIQSYSLNPKLIIGHVKAKEIKSFCDLSSKEINLIKEYTGDGYIRKIKKRFANNWKLFLAYFEDDVAGCAWVISNASEFNTKVVPLIDEDVAITDCWTIPTHRGKKVFPFLLSFLVNQLKKQKFRRAFIQANERNQASIKGIQVAGFEFLINYEAHKLFGWEFVIWKNYKK